MRDWHLAPGLFLLGRMLGTRPRVRTGVVIRFVSWCRCRCNSLIPLIWICLLSCICCRYVTCIRLSSRIPLSVQPRTIYTLKPDSHLIWLQVTIHSQLPDCVLHSSTFSSQQTQPKNEVDEYSLSRNLGVTRRTDVMCQLHPSTCFTVREIYISALHYEKIART